jgi:5-methylcytosine-specific restriction enzyme subunit McrC
VTHLSVREWGKVPISAKAFAGTFTVPQAEALVAAAQAHPIGGEDGSGILSDHRHYLKARQAVGVIAAPGCSLEILPKVDPDAPEEDAPTVRARLIGLLDIALGLDIGAGASTNMARGAESLLDILIRLFAERLLAETRRGLPRLYVAHEDDLPALRGRLDVMRQFTINAVRPDRLACRYDVLSHDIPLMQVMAVSVLTLRKHARAPDTQRLLDELRFALADVSLVPVSALPWDKVRIDRTNRRWGNLFALAKLLLKRDWQTTRHEALSRDGLTLLFPMNDLFESAIAALLRRALAGSGVEVVEQGGLKFCLGDWALDQDCKGRTFQTRPDIILKQRGKVLAVIDTKWKSLSADPLNRKKGVSQADVYQLMAYARLYNCQNLMLLYPCLPGECSGEIKRFGIDGGKEFLSICRIDMAMAPRSIEGALSAIGESLLISRNALSGTA